MASNKEYPTKLSDTSYFTQQFIPLDTIFYHPTINGVEEVPYRQFLKTDLPPMTELYFLKYPKYISKEGMLVKKYTYKL